MGSRFIGLLTTAWLLPAASLAGQHPRHEANVISLEEIATIHAQNAYQVVKHLRPQFLQSASHSPTTLDAGLTPAAQRPAGQDARAGAHGDEEESAPTPEPDPLPAVTVYFGMALLGGVEELARIRAEDVREIRYLSAADAQFRLGARPGGGAAIVVTPK